MLSRPLIYLILIGLAAATVPETASAADPAPQVSAGERLFVRQVWPVVVEKCLPCHGKDPEKLGGKLDLRSRQAMLAGGESGETVLKPGKAGESRLFSAVTWEDSDLRMPPKENDRLSKDQTWQIRDWINAGAPWPDEVRLAIIERAIKDEPAGVRVATSGGLSPEWTNRTYAPEDLWAYQPLRRVQPPVLEGVSNPIDAFIRQRLKEKGVSPAPPADSRTFLRRATYDLTGLPPTADEIEKSISADKSPHSIIDGLLASQHYGEQAARHWLDVVRYADTSGFSNDYERPHAWRYRDYVVRSFDADKPYDQFVLEQLAGDELWPDNTEMQIAVGYLRMGPWEHTGMTVAAITRQQFLDDVTNHVGVSLLGQALRCASCHDHKFDPVPTRDYYRIQAVFATTFFQEPATDFFQQENVAGFAEGRQQVQKRLDETNRVLAEIARKNKAAIEKETKAAEDLSRRDNLGLSFEELSLRKVSQKRKDYFERELRRFEPNAFSVYSGPANTYMSPRLNNPRPKQASEPAPAVHILVGGSLESPRDLVSPGVLSAVSLVGTNSEVPESLEGRRSAFARWVASPNNTLTARVMTNRVWQQHFGKGLVATPNNFGKMGAKPTHPELLDWLAGWFIDQGWSLKKLHRLIMTSQAYQQSGSHSDIERLQQLDARNDLLAYFPPRRLAAEEIRDSMLAASGELNREMGGPGIFPEIDWEVALQPRHIMGSVAPAYQPSPAREQRNRRTLYAFRYRTLADPLLEVFNRPGSETSCERRDETTVTPQAFALFNSDFAHRRALAMAQSIRKSADDEVAAAFRGVYGRLPSEDERTLAMAHIERMLKHHQAHPPQATELPKTVERHMVEEMTGTDIAWQETLDGMENYQRDVMPWDVDAPTRALAELCLVLLNSNEFLYVR